MLLLFGILCGLALLAGLTDSGKNRRARRQEPCPEEALDAASAVYNIALIEAMKAERKQ